MTTAAPCQCRVRRADWTRDQVALRALRTSVFVREQSVPEALEWDGLDADAVHLLAESDDGTPIGTARLLPSGQIGRMAVRRDRRARGVGTRLLVELLQIADAEGYPGVFLHAQVAALGFYRRCGFAPVGQVFDEAGIPHQRMDLADQTPRRLVDLQTRSLGRTRGELTLTMSGLRRQAVLSLARQARRELLLLTADLEPTLYDRADFVEQVARLARERRGRPPVRILLNDAEPVRRRGHRLVELGGRLTSAIRIQATPDDTGERLDQFLLADGVGYCLQRTATPGTIRVDFDAPAEARRLRARFERLWERHAMHIGLGRLYL